MLLNFVSEYVTKKKHENKEALKVNKHVTSWFVADCTNLWAKVYLVANTAAALGVNTEKTKCVFTSCQAEGRKS